MQLLEGQKNRMVKICPRSRSVDFSSFFVFSYMSQRVARRPVVWIPLCYVDFAWRLTFHKVLSERPSLPTFYWDIEKGACRPPVQGCRQRLLPRCVRKLGFSSLRARHAEARYNFSAERRMIARQI